MRGPRRPRATRHRHLRNPKILENQAKSSFRHAKMSIYKEERPSSDGHKITFPDSNDFIIQGMAPGECILDETGEIPVVLRGSEAPAQKSVNIGTLVSTSTNRHGFPTPAS